MTLKEFCKQHPADGMSVFSSCMGCDYYTCEYTGIVHSIPQKVLKQWGGHKIKIGSCINSYPCFTIYEIYLIC